MRSAAQIHADRLVAASLGGATRLGELPHALGALPRAAARLALPALGLVGTAIARRPVAFFTRLAQTLTPAADAIDSGLIDLSPGEPTVAADIYAGSVTFAGKTMMTGGRSIFRQPAPSHAFAQALHGFDWLRHLAAADTPLARLNARVLIEDWIALEDEKRVPQLACAPVVAATRLRSWLVHAHWLLAGSTPAFQRQLLAQVTRDFRLTRQAIGLDGPAQIRVKTSLVAATVLIPAYRRFRAAAFRQLDQTLTRQILADGGHISRNPAVIVEILADLLPLRAALTHAGTPASGAMMNSIDRMLPMLRFFSGPGGILAHFNGAAPVVGGLIDAVLAADDTGGRAHGNASHSGYQRLEAAGAILLMDCGTPPPFAYAGQAHAGTLSFEFASGTNRFVTNCGTSPFARREWRTAARQTAAHSALVVDAKSSARPIETGLIAQLIGPMLIGGPRSVHVDRREHGGAIAVVASHDGYAASHNLIHERTLRLSPAGDRIDGRDLLMPAHETPVAPVPFCVRFHLDPAISPVLLASGVVMLIAPDGEAWEFHAEDISPRLEESIYLADPAGPVPTRQIVLTAALPETVEQRWTLVRTRGATQADHSPVRP